MTTIDQPTKRRLRSHYGFAKLPFTKGMYASEMFDSESQRELRQGLNLWSELKGLSLVIGPSGVGKSITLRRYVEELDDARFRVVSFTYLPTTVHGFLRSLARRLGLQMRMHTSDLFDDLQKHLTSYEQEQGPHPILLVDDGEGLTPAVVDVLRRLTCYDLDAEDRFSMLLSGTEDLLRALRHHSLDTFRSRIAFAHTLKPFGLDDTRNYIRFHLKRADTNQKLVTDTAVKRIFHASKGRPRNINQLTMQALIYGVVHGFESIDTKAIDAAIADNPLYATRRGES